MWRFTWLLLEPGSVGGVDTVVLGAACQNVNVALGREAKRLAATHRIYTQETSGHDVDETTATTLASHNNRGNFHADE